DVFVLKTGGIGTEKSLLKSDDARVPPLALNPVTQTRLVPEETLGLGVGAEFQGNGLVVVEVDMPGLPDLAESANAEQFDQLPVGTGQRAFASLEARRLTGEECEDIPC